MLTWCLVGCLSFTKILASLPFQVEEAYLLKSTLLGRDRLACLSGLVRDARKSAWLKVDGDFTVVQANFRY